MKTKAIFNSIIITFTFATLLMSCGKEAPITFEKKAPSCIQNKNKPVFNTNDFNNLLVTNYDTTVCGLLPLGKSYKWIYKDSLFDNAGQFVEIKMDTLYVEKTVKSLADNSTLWKMKSSRPKAMPNYIYTNDSVLYALSTPYSFNNSPFISNEWFKIYEQDSVRKGSVYSDVAYIETTKKLNSITIVPAGSFTNCIKNTKTYNGVEEIIFKPELGIIKYTKNSPYGHPFNPTAADKRQVSELVAFIK